MNTIHIEDFYLTTDHPSSSYGIPVMVVRGVAYGPKDTIINCPTDPLDWLQETAEGKCLGAALRLGLTDDPMVQRFINQIPSPMKLAEKYAKDREQLERENEHNRE